MHAMNVVSAVEELQKLDAELRQREPKWRIRDRALHLGVKEVQLVAADCGLISIELDAPMQQLLTALGGLGPVMALSRNPWCVHERVGCYEQIEAGGHVGLVLGPDIDLRLFLGHWACAYAVACDGRQSIQFFDHCGEAIHKVYVTAETNTIAYACLVRQFGRADKRTPRIMPVLEQRDTETVSNPAALREHWLSLRDTHDFYPMLRAFNVGRLGALRAAEADLAQQVACDAVVHVLKMVAASALPIMCFVGNRGIVQIHTGSVSKLLRTGPWFNVLDETFNLHLNTEAIDSLWVVNKPSCDGWITSLEAYAAGGELMVQFFGARKPGIPELQAWRELMVGLCSKTLAC